ncbi:MAG: DUF3885 domain-containing protein [Tumebacillaceae bacterium]
MNLNMYMSEHFPKLELRRPLFYLAPIGLRFEIGPAEEEAGSSSYMAEVNRRAQTLFQELHEPDDPIFLVVNALRRKGELPSKRRELTVFRKYVRDARLLKHLTCAELPDFYAGEEEVTEESWQMYRYSLACRVSNLKVSPLLKAIVNQDFPSKREPVVSEEVYVVHANKHIIFHLYDDCGCDIVANRTESLTPIYTKYNHWILDYDRDRIDNTMRGK